MTSPMMVPAATPTSASSSRPARSPRTSRRSGTEPPMTDRRAALPLPHGTPPRHIRSGPHRGRVPQGRGYAAVGVRLDPHGRVWTGERYRPAGGNRSSEADRLAGARRPPDGPIRYPWATGAPDAAGRRATRATPGRACGREAGRCRLRPARLRTATPPSMLRAARDAAAVIAGVARAAIANDMIRVRALVNGVTEIGEAAARLPPDGGSQIGELPWREIVGRRNIVVHVSGGIDVAEPIKTAYDDMPVLAAALARSLADWPAPAKGP